MNPELGATLCPDCGQVVVVRQVVTPGGVTGSLVALDPFCSPHGAFLRLDQYRTRVAIGEEGPNDRHQSHRQTCLSKTRTW